MIPIKIFPSSLTLDQILPYCCEHSVENSFPQSDVFNNTSVHIFPRNLLDKAPDDLWHNCPEPRYADSVEIQLNAQSMWTIANNTLFFF